MLLLSASSRPPNRASVAPAAFFVTSHHPGGKPISASTHRGLSVAPPDDARPSLTAASVSVTPACRPLSVERSADPEPFASARVGVGHSDDEDSRATVRRAKVSGGNPQGAGSVAKRLQIPEHLAHPSPFPARDVFDDDVGGLELVEDPAVLSPQSRASPIEAGPEAGGADVLTGEAPTDDVDFLEVSRSSLGDIAHTPICVWPVSSEHRSTPWILLDLPRNLAESSQLKPQLEPANP